MNLSKEEIKKYLETDLFQESGLSNLSEESKMAILAKLADIVYLRFINELSVYFSDEEAEKLNQLVYENNVEEFAKMVESKVPNYNEILSNIIAEEKKALLEVLTLGK